MVKRHRAEILPGIWTEVVQAKDYDELETSAKYFGECNARNADKANRLEAALRQARTYVYNAECADAAELEARHATLSLIDAFAAGKEVKA